MNIFDQSEWTCRQPGRDAKTDRQTDDGQVERRENSQPVGKGQIWMVEVNLWLF